MKLEIRMNTNIQEMMDRLGNDIAGGMHAGMQNLVEVIRGKAAKNAPVRTSNLANAISGEVSEDGTKGRVFVTDNAPYAVYVHEGTGLFGPFKQKIVPKNKKALYWSGAAHPVRSVKGQKPQPFLADAAADTDAQAEFEHGMGNYLKKKGY